jgi:hypothetical protein
MIDTFVNTHTKIADTLSILETLYKNKINKSLFNVVIQGVVAKFP